MTHPSKTHSRRHVIVTTAAYAAGFALTVVSSSRKAVAASANVEPWSDPLHQSQGELSAWVAIAPDDTVTIRVATPEIGNGAMTQGAMTITEELCCDWSKVRAEPASPNRDYREGSVYSTGAGTLPFFAGHSTDANRQFSLLQAGASARERLKVAAAQVWRVPASEIETKDSLLTHAKTGRTLRYGEVAAQAAEVHLAQEPAIKPQSEWTFLGVASPAKLNLPQIVDGKATYGIDVQRPDMVYAALQQSPVHGGKLKHFDAQAVMGMPGVRAVVSVDPSESRGLSVESQATYSLDRSTAQSAVAVIADHYWQAKKALEALPVEWEDGDGAKWKTTDQVYQAALSCLDSPGEKVEREVGAPDAVDQQPKIIEATYLAPYSDQVPIEPLNGTAIVTDDKVEVWQPTQDPKQALWVASDETGLSPDKVFIHPTFVGGAFGRRVYGNDVRMVVAIARRYPGVPVKVIWSREEMMRQGRYRAMVAAKLRVGFDDQMIPQALHGRLVVSGKVGQMGLTDSPYAMAIIPNVRIESQKLPMHILIGPYRAPGYNSFAFMMESFIDECAVATDADPLEYRLNLLAKWPDPGLTQCLKVAAAKAGWGKSLPKGTGQGVAISNWPGRGKPQAGTTVCVVATVEVSQRGEIKVQALDITFDSGRIVNRAAVAAQLEGGAIFALNMSLNEELTISDGRIVEGNFNDYPMLRIGDMPQINVHFEGLSGHDRFGMIGEAPVGPVGPAIANAIFSATGKRIRTMPFRHHDLSWS
jgi:isoquinoline 1-oxidoreductase beta subunit